MRNPILIALASALITAGVIRATPALAAERQSGETNVSVVHTADLDLRTAAGQRQLDKRLASAARDVCGAASDADLAGKNDVRKCRDETLAQVRVQQKDLVAAARRGDVIAVVAAR